MINPQSLAAFIASDDAADWIDALASLRGMARRTLLDHVRAIAGPAPLAIEAPLPEDFESRVLERRRRGEIPAQIARNENVDPTIIHKLLARMVNEGVKFPPAPRGGAARKILSGGGDDPFPPSNKTGLTEDQKLRAKTLMDLGQKPGAIAKALGGGVTRKQVANYLYLAKGTKPQRKAYKRDPEVEARHAEVRKLHLRGMTNKAIAEELKIEPHRVDNDIYWMRQHGKLPKVRKKAA
jgi:transposase